MKKIGIVFAVLSISCLALVLSGCGSGSGEIGPGDKPSAETPLRVAVITGSHPFDVPHFYQMFRELPGIDAYPQHLEQFASSSEEDRDSYDVVLFYNMPQPMPEDEGQPHYAGKPKAAIERLIERGQGIVILHHGILAWKDWDLWNQLIGYDNRNFRYKEGIDLDVKVADTEHPITQGVEPFTIHDEGYVLKGVYDNQGDALLTVEHQDSLPQVAWARTHDKSRVFVFPLGHDNQSWSNPAFRTILAQGIAWTADRPN